MDVTREEDHAPGIAPPEKIQMQGQCRYCKQYRLVWALPGTSQEELNEIAEAECNCPEGESVRMRTYNRNTAYAWAESKWPKDSTMYYLMTSAIEAVTGFDIEKITINADGTTKYDMRLDKEERLIINEKRTETKKKRF